MREAVQLKKRLEIEEDHLNRLVAVCEGRFNPKYKRSGDVKKDIQSARNEAAEVFAFLAEADQECEQKRRDEICDRNFEMLAKGWKPRAKRESSASCSFEKDIEALQKDFP